MRDLGRRLVIALGIAVAAAAAIGYAWIAGGIAQPLGLGLGSVERPSQDGAFPLRLDDGRPAWVIRDGGRAWVLDARAPVEAGEAGRLVVWCGDGDGVFLDLVGGGTFAPDGRLIGGPGDRGLVVLPTTPSEGGAILEVGREGSAAPVATGEPIALDCPPGTPTRSHLPEPAEIFDPSVAAAEEPRGWVWMEGTLAVVEGAAFLCDGLGGACASGAEAHGIDPARVPADDRVLAGSFIGRVEDGAVVDLSFAPDSGGGT